MYTSYSAYRRRWLRSPDGIIAGVCSGLGRRIGISKGLIRIVTFIAFLTTGFFPVGLAYLLLAIFLPVGPDY